MRRYYEFALMIVIIGILASVLLWALRDVQGNMEEAGVQAEAAAIRTQLLETLAHREAFGGRLPDSDNPVDWIADRPPNYLGSLDRPPSMTGVWYFDTSSQALIYVFHDGHLARFRLSRLARNENSTAMLASIGLLRLGKNR